MNSFTSVSLDPPLVLVCIGHEASVIQYFREASHFGISILAESQRELSDHFARKGHDRFGGTAWHPGESGAPLLDEALALFECRLERTIPLGDHDIFVGEVLHASYHEEGRPLTYFASRYRHLA